MTLDASHPKVAERGLHLHVNGVQYGPASTLPLASHSPTLAFHAAPSAGRGGEVCFDEIAVFMDPLTPDSVSDLYTYGLGRGQPEAVKQARAAAALQDDERQQAMQGEHFNTARLKALAPAHQHDEH